jgi:Flp pilus assembly protein, pilin Flp
MKNILKSLLTEEEGQGMTEYALVLGVIAIGAITLITGFKSQVESLWGKITTEIGNALTSV